MSVGTRIMYNRKLKKLTQADLGAEIGVSYMTVRRWETGKSSPDINDLQKISSALNVPIEELLGNESEKPTGSGDSVAPAIGEDKSDRDNLVYEWGGGHKLRLPNTPETRKLFQEIVLRSMSGVEPAIA